MTFSLRTYINFAFQIKFQMHFNTRRTSFQKQFYRAIFIPALIGIFMVMSFVFERGMGLDFYAGGIYPRRPEHLWGIFTIIFIHSGWSHLINNLISFEILSGFLFFFYREIAIKVFIISYIVSGLLLWMIGRDAWHVGASGLIYALAFFVFFSGFIREYVPLIAVSLIVAFVYGSMVWHVFPWQANDPISWEGHLSGAFIGLTLAIWYRHSPPQRPVDLWDDESNDDESSMDEFSSEIINENEIDSE